VVISSSPRETSNFILAHRIRISGCEMVSETFEVECPVCDQKVPSDATHCPNCGAEFNFSGVEELKKVAREINDPGAGVRVPVTKEVVEQAPAAAVPSESAGEERRKDGLFGKLFKKKR